MSQPCSVFPFLSFLLDQSKNMRSSIAAFGNLKLPVYENIFIYFSVYVCVWCACVYMCKHVHICMSLTSEPNLLQSDPGVERPNLTSRVTHPPYIHSLYLMLDYWLFKINDVCLTIRPFQWYLNFIAMSKFQSSQRVL